VAEVFLALGSNLGDRRSQLRAAVDELEKAGVHIRQASSLYESEPMYETNQPRFLNAVVQAETNLSPEELLAAAKAVEQRLGRQPRERNGPREIDVDILLYGDEVRATDVLTIPHPRMQERPFVQAPLAEVAGHPQGESPGLLRIEGPLWAATTPAKVRAFVAVDVDERIRKQVARVQNALRPAAGHVKWVDPKLCHLTLAFLGYVAQDRMDGIARACHQAAASMPPFDLSFRGIGAFPRWRGARVLWMGVATGEAPLRALHRELEARLEPLGFEPEGRPFSPHLTLGRFKTPAGPALQESAKPFEHERFGTVRVSELRLMRSNLRPSGPVYSVLEAFPLSPAAPDP